MPRLITPRFVVAWCASLFQGLSFFLFVHLPGYLRELGATEAMIGIVAAATAFSALAIRPWLGRSLDKIGRRPILLVGNTLNVVVIACYFTVDAVDPWLFIVRIAHGIAIGLVFSAMLTYAGDMVPPAQRTQGLALFGVAGLLPIALGGASGDFITGRWGFDGLFVAALVFAVIALALCVPLREMAEKLPAGMTVSFTRPLVQRDLVPIWWISFAFAFTLTAYFTFLRTFVDTTGIGSVGAFFGIYAVTAIILRLLFGWVPDRVGPKKVLYPAVVVFCAGLVILAGATGTETVMLAGLMCGVGHGYLFPIMLSITFERAGVGDRGSAATIFTGVFDLGTLVAGPTLGWLIVATGYPTMFVTAAGFLVAACIAFAVWDGDLRRRAKAPLES